jgi:uncharacterized protein (TIGR03086 family)
MVDIRELDRRALTTTESIVRRVDAGGLDRPTPCAEWSLGQLLAHMVGQNYGFAAAAGGETSDRSVWADRPVGDDPARDFAASVAAVTRAFAEPDMLQRELWLPEIRGGQSFTAQQAIGFHFLDYVVHGWDVAAAIGVKADFDSDLLDALLPMAQRVPDGASRQGDSAAFQPGKDRVGGGDVFHQILSLLGRSPTWSAVKGA